MYLRLSFDAALVPSALVVGVLADQVAAGKAVPGDVAATVSAAFSGAAFASSRLSSRLLRALRLARSLNSINVRYIGGSWSSTTAFSRMTFPDVWSTFKTVLAASMVAD